jgi:large subunit ribosomal protein L30
MSEQKKLKITLVRSMIGVPEKMRRVVRALGLRKMHQSVIHDDNAVINGMVFKANHLLKVERIKK